MSTEEDDVISERIGYALTLQEFLGFRHAVSAHEVPADYLLSCLSDPTTKDITRMFLRELRVEALKVEGLSANLYSCSNELMRIVEMGAFSEDSIYSLVEQVKGRHFVIRYKLDNNMGWQLYTILHLMVLHHQKFTI